MAQDYKLLSLCPQRQNKVNCSIFTVRNMDVFILIFTSQLRKTGHHLQMSKKHNQTEQ